MPTSAKHQPAAAASKHGISIRRFAATDSIPEITKLLHRAYAKQMAMGLQPLAGRQDDETTIRRCNSGECYLALQGPKIVGTILFHEVEDAKGPPWFQNRFVDSFSQFAVDPDLQGLGIGQLLLDKCEARAQECGSTELGLSMAEPDTALMQFYTKRGYRFIENWQWPYTNYRSAILSKTLKK
jgi:GNAT superfamily N-acetyltransferase